MTLGRPGLGNIMYMIHHLLLHLAVAFKYWERNFNSFKIVLRVVIGWQHSSAIEVLPLNDCIHEIHSWESVWDALAMLESLLTVVLAATGRQALGYLLSRRSCCCQCWLGTASQRNRSVVFSSDWITTMPDAEGVCAFFKWRKEPYVLNHILNWQKSMICFIKASSRSNTHWFHSNCFRSVGVIPVYTLWEYGTCILKGN